MNKTVAAFVAVSFLGGISSANAQEPVSLPVAPPPPLIASSHIPKERSKKPETNLPGFMGIKWGSTLEEARAVLKTQGAVISEVTKSRMTASVTGLKVLGYTPLMVALSFGNEGFYRATVFFAPPLRGHVFEAFTSIEAAVNREYGKAPVKFRTLSPPFKKGQEEQALEAGEASIGDFWEFSTGKEKSALAFTIEKTMRISLAYEATKRADKEQERRDHEQGGG